jgi:hypothetical protein
MVNGRSAALALALVQVPALRQTGDHNPHGAAECQDLPLQIRCCECPGNQPWHTDAEHRIQPDLQVGAGLQAPELSEPLPPACALHTRSIILGTRNGELALFAVFLVIPGPLTS